MKKYLIKISLLFIAFILTSCGGGSATSNSSGSNKNSLQIETKESIFDKEKNILGINFVVQNNYNQEIEVSLKNLSIDVNPCNVRKVSMTPKSVYFSENIQKENVTALVEFVGECNPSSYKISSSKILTLNDKSNTIAYKSDEMELHPTIVVPEENNETEEVEKEIYSFFNVPSPITVDKANQTYNFKVQLIDDKLQGVPDKEVKILTYDISYGEIENFTVTTDNNGFANFVFKSAKDISKLAGKALSLTVVQGENLSTISTNINFNFKVSPITPKEYKFKNPTSIIVENANESKNISIDLINNLGIGVEGKTIQITTIPSKLGSINSSTVTTNAAGRAIFKYTAPANLDIINGQSTTVTVSYNDEGTTIRETIKISIRKALEEVSEQYSFQNATSITIGKGNESKNISIDLVNSSGIGVSGEVVQITNIPSEFGSINTSKTTTNDAGRATFFYTAPENIDSIDGKSTMVKISFIMEGSATISQSISITIKKSTDTVVGDKTLPTIVIPNELRDITLKTNSKSFDIPIKVYKDVAPYTSGSVSVELPEKVLNGADVGSFTAFTVPVNEQGIALFHYTGPVNLKALIDAGDKGSTFKFYHEDNPAEENRQSLQINYAIADDIYIPVDYELSLTTENNDFSMGIPELQKTFTILLKDKKGNIIKNSDVNFTKINVETQNSLIAQIYDTVNRDSVNNLTLKNENSASFIIKSKKLSGIVPLKATVTFLDINKEEKELSSIINVRVMSGPPSAISVSYVSTGQDEARAKYIEKFAISVTDEYGNKVNTRPYISLGAIVGYTVDGKESSGHETNDTRRLFYGRNEISKSSANGVIDALGDELVNTTNFEDTTNSRSNVFKYVNAEGANSDKLVVFGAGKNYEAMGKWDFEKIDNHTLKIQDDYFGEYRDGLYYAVGHNYYQDQCQDDGREWLGSTDSESYQLDEQGTVQISYKYDYHLTGKDALIWVNLNGYQSDTKKDTRIGEVVKHTLRGRGLRQVPEGGYSLDKGQSGYAHFVIWHENAPERYRNANFAHAILAGSTCSYTRVASSNWNDARTCKNGRVLGNNKYYGSNDGGSFVTYYIEAPADKGCSFNITRLLTSDEFKRINGND